MQPPRSHSAPRLRGVLAAILAALLLVGVGGTAAPAAGVSTRSAVQSWQPGADQGPASSTTHHAVTPHAAKVGVPKRPGSHPGTAAATTDRSAAVTTEGTTEGTRPRAPLHLTRSRGSSDGRAPPA